MYIKQVFQYHYGFWRYIIGTLVVLAAVLLGQVPFAVAVFLEKGLEIESMEETEFLQVLDPNLSLFLMLLAFAAGLAGIFIAVRLLHGQSLRALTTSRKKVDWGRFFFAFGLIGSLTVLLTLADYFSNPADYLVNFQPIPFLILVLVALVMIPLQTSFEEYFFRGYLMQGLGTLVRNRWLPLILTSVVFGGLHFFNPEVTKLGNIIMLYYIGTGFMLGIITLMDEGLELALGFHAANNLVAALLVTADWTAFQTYSILKDVSEPEAGWDVLVPILVVYPILLLIMAKKYGWRNWGEKLTGRVEKPEILKVSEES